MEIENFLWLADIIEKLDVKHNVETWEVEEVFANKPQIQYYQRGNRPGENVYTALGQTEAGRYLFVVFIYKPRNQDRRVSRAVVTSARDMDKKERKRYERS